MFVCNVERVQEEGWNVPTALPSQRSKAQVRAFSPGPCRGELKVLRCVSEGNEGCAGDLLRSVLHAVHAPSPIELLPRSQALEWKQAKERLAGGSD